MVLLLCTIGWNAPHAAAEPDSRRATAHATIGDTRDNVPQWQDIGMCDVLAVTGGSTLTPPTTVRVVHDSPAGFAPAAHAAAARHFSVHRLPALVHRRTVSGYIYMIHCLRL